MASHVRDEGGLAKRVSLSCGSAIDRTGSMAHCGAAIGSKACHAGASSCNEKSGETDGDN